MTGHVKKSTDF